MAMRINAQERTIKGKQSMQTFKWPLPQRDKLRPGKIKDPTLETGREQQTTFADRRLFIGRSPAGPPDEC
jgi:hypothetical protein